MNKKQKKLLEDLGMMKLNSNISIQQDDNMCFTLCLDIGPFTRELDAVHMASYVYATKSIDFTDLIKPLNTTLH